jgi:hypothetical protein
MRGGTRIIASAILLIAFSAFPQESVMSGGMVRVNTAGVSLISQGTTEGCGPVSLLNLLKLGPEKYRAAYAKLTGGRDTEALKALLAKYCSEKKSDGKARYSKDRGIDDPNLIKLSNLVAKDFDLGAIDSLYANRRKGEENAAFARRINEPLLRSLRRGVPVLMSVDSYAVRDREWRKLTGHYMLITGAQALGTANPHGFLIEYINPVGAKAGQSLVYASTRRPSRALAHFADGDRWLDDNPYLYIAAPSLDLSESRQPSEARHEYFFTIMFGQFTAGPASAK